MKCDKTVGFLKYSHIYLTCACETDHITTYVILNRRIFWPGETLVNLANDHEFVKFQPANFVFQIHLRHTFVRHIIDHTHDGSC